MQITCQKENLQRPISLLSRYVSSRPALPVLANLLLEASENQLTISATNLDVTVKAIIPAQVQTPGKLTLPARPFAEFIAMLPSGQITLTQSEEQCIASTAQTQASFATITTADFPVLPYFTPSHAFAFPLELLKEVSDKVLFAAATDETRPVLTNLLIRQEDNQLAFVATDGFRLSEQLKPMPERPPLNAESLLLPAKIMAEILRISNEIKADQLWIDTITQPNQVALKVDDIEFYSKLIDAAYPNYRRIIPAETTTNLELNREELLQAVKISLVFAKDAGSLIKFDINPSSGYMEVVAQSANLGQNQTKVEITGEGSELVTAFNSRFLMDMLNTLKDDRLKLSFKAALSPMVATIPGRSDFLHLIMPIDVQ